MPREKREGGWGAIVKSLELKIKKLKVFLYLCRVNSDVMKFKAGYKVRSIAGENVVIMQGAVGSDMTRIISLNDSSLFLWNKLQDREFVVADVAAALIEEYEIDTEIAERDAAAWVEKLAECGLI